MQHGGGSKDTWVLGDGPVSQTTLMPPAMVPLQVSRATFELPSRVADNLFWVGRYVERIEFAVRISRAILSRINQESDSASDAAIDTSLRILAALGHVRADATASNGRPSSDRDLILEREIVAMIHDSSDKTSLGWTLKQLRRVAYLLRDRFSVDAWRILNRFDRQFSRVQPREPVRSGRALNLLDDAIATLSAFGGLVMESMTRGDGWRFLEIGRRLERALQMVEMLRQGFRAKSGDESGALTAILEIADSSLTYRSRYLTSTQPDLVLDLLLLDEANPRSVAFQLERLREYVEALPKRSTSARMSPEWRLVVKLLSAVELADASELMNHDREGTRSDAPALLVSLADGLRSLSETITRDYFDHTIASRQMGAS